MVTDMFGGLLKELGDSLGHLELHPDQNNACFLKLKDDLTIQIELERSGQFLLLASDLGSVPPGKYRENLFREALKANDLPHPLNGILCYSQKKNHLVLFEKISLTDLNGEKVAAEIKPFTEKAAIWASALKRGDVPVVNQAFTSDRLGGGMFGLR